MPWPRITAASLALHAPAASSTARPAILAERYQYAPLTATPAQRRAPVAPHAHDFYQLAYSPTSQGHYLAASTRHHLGPGQLAIIPPHLTHAIDEHGHDHTSLDWWMLEIPTTILSAPTAAGAESRRIIHADPALVALYATLFVSLHTQGVSALTRHEAWHALADALTPNLGHQPAPSPTRSILNPTDRRRAENAADIIRLASTDLTLDDLATHVGVSVDHLRRIFRQRFGVPPHRFQLLLRIDRARALLRAGHSGQQAALRTGFVSAPHLARALKRYFTTTPHAYQTRHDQS
ncbi:MAG: AraC family transcriptional regulator [Phycisphaerales bacterium]|jgi:AraC-like DNA-binding protein|nr:AraC family transcriptional regulator [Phycisphaerales bacterium]